MKKAKKAITLILILVLSLALPGCGKDEAAVKTQLIINDGEFSEMQLIHYMAKLLVEEHTDLTVNIKEQMSGVNLFRELTNNQNGDLFNSYDGTLLTTFLKLDPDEVPEGMTLYDFANQEALKKFNVRLLDKLGLNNTYALAVPQSIADQYGLTTISDLVPVAPQLIFGAEHEFYSEEGSMKYGPFVEFYGLKFKDSLSVDLGLKYAAIENGNFQVTEVYATDGLNKKAQLKVLEDDKGFFPEYNGAILVRADLFEDFKETAPNLEEVLNMLGGKFTNEIMTDLTYAVDVEGRSVAEVAEEFLKSQDLI